MRVEYILTFAMFATHAAIIISLYALTDPCLANRKHMLRPTYKRNLVGSECGRPLGNEYVIETDRIVAGYDVGYYRYPWYAALVRSNQVNCGGALIGPQIVLTAAHCFKEYLHSASQGGKLEDIYTVRLGMYNICASEKEVTEYRVVKVEIHELYPKKKPYYDICLLTLANSTDSYRPVCLPNLSLNSSSRPKEGTVPGMGTLKYQGETPCTLHEARLLTYDDSSCKKMINSTGNNPDAMVNAFCAGYLQGGIDTCQGDSGGPLQYINENGDYVVIGIVSFGFRCAEPGYLGLYTDVSRYIDWIEEKSGLSAIQSPSPSTQAPHRKPYVHYDKPYRSPLRIIILKNRKFHEKTKLVKHVPIKRTDHQLI